MLENYAWNVGEHITTEILCKKQAYLYITDIVFPQDYNAGHSHHWADKVLGHLQNLDLPTRARARARAHTHTHTHTHTRSFICESCVHSGRLW